MNRTLKGHPRLRFPRTGGSVLCIGLIKDAALPRPKFSKVCQRHQGSCQVKAKASQPPPEACRARMAIQLPEAPIEEASSPTAKIAEALWTDFCGAF